MAQVEREKENKRDNRRAKAREARQRRESAQAAWDWDNVDWGQLRLLMIAFADAGGALRIGLTRDGGALALGCYMGDDYATEYVRPNEDIWAALNEIAGAWLPDGGEKFWEALEAYAASKTR